jgi:hypothetical protein
MAIHPDYPGLEVCIMVYGQPLPECEYEDEVDNATVTKYLEVRAGSEFAIGYKFLDPFPNTRDIHVTCMVDGLTVRRGCCYKHKLKIPGFHTASGLSVQEGKEWSLQNFRFGKLDIGKSESCADQCVAEQTATNNLLVEADSIVTNGNDPLDMNALGTTRLEFEFGRTKLSENPVRLHQLPTPGNVSETALKGKPSHCVSSKLSVYRRLVFAHSMQARIADKGQSSQESSFYAQPKRRVRKLYVQVSFAS